MIQLKLEQDILQFINDNRNLFKRFPQTTSYYNAITTGSYLFGDEQKCWSNSESKSTIQESLNIGPQNA